MVRFGARTVSDVRIGRVPVDAVYAGRRLVWQRPRPVTGDSEDTCITQQGWRNDLPWSNDKGWDN